MLERQRDLYGRVPEQAALDGGFASRDKPSPSQRRGRRRCRLRQEVRSRRAGHGPQHLKPYRNSPKTPLCGREL